MATYRLKVSEVDFHAIERLVLSDHPKEGAALALAGAAKNGDGSDVLVRRVVPVPQRDFVIQEELRLEVSSRAINGLASLCEANHLGFVLCHSHPTDLPYSAADDMGERRIVRTLRPFLPEGAPTASLLFWPGGVRGRVWLPGRDLPEPLSEILIVGRTLRRVIDRTVGEDGPACSSNIYDRQVRAFGADGQARLSRTRVAIVGVGGTGSAVAEQLVRMGVQDLVLIDPDHVDLSNITRMYGTLESQVARAGEPPSKVEAVRKHLQAISAKARVLALKENVVHDVGAGSLLDRDVVFLCTDTYWSRSVVNQIAYQYMIPTLNLGMRIDSQHGTVSAASGAVDFLLPDYPCLWCKQTLTAAAVASETMPPAERAARAQEGYVEGTGTPAPSVICFTTTIAGLAVGAFLHLVTGCFGEAELPHGLRYDILLGAVRRAASTTASGCICRKVRGCGDLRSRSTVLNQA